MHLEVKEDIYLKAAVEGFHLSAGASQGIAAEQRLKERQGMNLAFKLRMMKVDIIS
ncbi:MAG: hypothetical protein ACLRMZ_10990 [Blautia marasmi]